MNKLLIYEHPEKGVGFLTESGVEGNGDLLKDSHTLEVEGNEQFIQSLMNCTWEDCKSTLLQYLYK